MDLVCRRDLLTRLTPAMQKKAIYTLHYSLKPSSFLLPGSSEAVGAFTNLFKLEDEKRKIYSRMPGPSYMPYRLLPGADSMEKVEVDWRANQILEESDVDSAAQREGNEAEAASAGRGRGRMTGQLQRNYPRLNCGGSYRPRANICDQ
jgi:hypothetical protein